MLIRCSLYARALCRYAHFWFSPELPQLGSVVKRRSHNEETIDIWDGKEVLRHTLKQGLHVLVPRAADQLTRLRELLLKDDDLSVVGLALDLLPIRQQDVDTFAVMKVRLFNGLSAQG